VAISRFPRFESRDEWGCTTCPIKSLKLDDIVVRRLLLCPLANAAKIRPVMRRFSAHHQSRW
jgi:hypothetical protein